MLIGSHSACLGAETVIIVLFLSSDLICQYLFKLARRCSSPRDPPSQSDWPEIRDLDSKTTTVLSVREFIVRSKLDPK